LSIDIQIEIIANKALDGFLKMSKNIKDMKPIYKRFVKYYTGEIIPASFESRGKLMQGSRWQKYSPAYLKWKQKHAPGKKMMTLTDDLYKAATGGSGFYSRIDNRNVVMGIKKSTIKYSNAQQRGSSKTNLPARPYFMTPKGLPPARAINWLIQNTNDHIMKGF